MRQRSSLILFWCALALAIIVRVYTLIAGCNGLDNDTDAYRRIANSLQERGTFSVERRFRLASGGGATTNFLAFRPPLYPWLLSWGPETGSKWFPEWVGGLNLLFGIGTVTLAWLCAKRWELSFGAACFAAFLVLIDPLLNRQAAQVMTETMATFLAIASLYALSRLIDHGVSKANTLGAGALLGLAVLCRPTFLPWVVLVVAYLAVSQWRTHGSPVRGILLAIGLIVALLPWGIRNYSLFGKPILTTTHGGYTLYRANNPFYYRHLRDTSWGTVWRTGHFDSEASRASRQAPPSKPQAFELEKDTSDYANAFQAIRDEPGMFLYACLIRLERFYGMVPWQTNPNESARGRWLRCGIGVFYFFEFALAIVGVCTLGRKLFAPPWIWGTLLVVSFTAVHTFYWTDMRMRAPIVPVIAMLAAVGAGCVWGRLRPASELALSS